MHGKSNIKTYITICKIDTNRICCMAQGTQTGSLCPSRGAEDGREVLKGGDIYIHLWLFHAEV